LTVAAFPPRTVADSRRVVGVRGGSAREHGVFRTAKVLRLEYGKLKRMAESASGSPQRAAVPTAFLELMPQPAGVSDCLIEVEGPGGKMRLQWKGATASDLAGLIRVWKSA